MQAADYLRPVKRESCCVNVVLIGHAEETVCRVLRVEGGSRSGSVHTVQLVSHTGGNHNEKPFAAAPRYEIV
jgi:hypothetical protein